MKLFAYCTLQNNDLFIPLLARIRIFCGSGSETLPPNIHQRDLQNSAPGVYPYYPADRMSEIEHDFTHPASDIQSNADG